MKASILPRALRTPRMLLWTIVAAVGLTAHANVASASCSAPKNAIEAENCLTGTFSNNWEIDDVGDTTIQGFATDTSVNVGQTINFKVNTSAKAYTITIYRIGYYGGDGGRQVAQITPSAKLPQVQPACLTDSSTGLYDCGNWAVSASWTVPSTAVSGVYYAVLKRTDTGGASPIVFVVRNDSNTADIVVRVPDESWQAYNDYGGHSFYGPSGNFDLTNRAYKVSFNRPYTTLDLEDESWLFWDTAPMIHWLEANGYNVTYISSVDTARNPSLLLHHKLVMSVGHDEYVSGPERTSIEAARSAGVNLAFFSGNEFFWKTRFETAIDGSGTQYRTLVCYKETLGPQSVPVALAAVDPQDPPTWTGTWRDPTNSPQADGGRPENALTGQLFRVNGPGADNSYLPIQVPATYAKLRFWRNTQIATLPAGQVYTMPTATLGYEWDVEEDNGSRPAGEFDLSSTTQDLTTDYLLDWGGLYGAGTATHHLSMYRASSGALVFGAGTVQWSWGLDNDHTGPVTPTDTNMQQATVNLFADMGVQPATLQAGLLAATASTDHTPPTSTVTSPTAGKVVHEAATVTISGTAVDAGGGIVAGVEVSTDGGGTWHPASGTTSWTYSWTPSAAGTAVIESRAVDDSANLETPTRSVSVSISTPQCPCTVFDSQLQPVSPNQTDNVAYELGMKFESAVQGQITAIRYWRAPSETGSHTGRIWSASGSLLATVAFTGETASGWQRQPLTTPLAIQGNTEYVVSVNVNHYYVATDRGLQNAVANGELSSVADGANGVFGGPATFPASSYNNSNYFRDVEFSPTAGVPSIAKLSGDGQAGNPGDSLANPLVVQVLDANAQTKPGATVTFTVTAGGGSVSPTSVVTDSAGEARATLTLGSNAGVVTVSASVANVGSVNFTATTQQDTLFTTQSPAGGNLTDGVAYELGTKFRSSLPGLITAIRYWKAPSEPGSHVGRIWSASGTLLASVPFSGESYSGWQLQALSSPLAIAPNTTYVVTVNTNAYYVGTNSGLASSIVNGPLATVADGADGVYTSTLGAFPTLSWQSTNYFRDISFMPSTVVMKSSGDAQAGPVGAALPNPLVATVLDASGHPVAGATVTFQVTVGNGSVSTASAVTNASGNASTTLTLGSVPGTNTVQAAVAGVGTTSFTATGQPLSVFTTQTPASPNVTDNVSYELGMKFQSSKGGQITSIRYYRAPSETGTHVGNIWSASGTLLATVTFSGETGSGWQVQSLSTPLTIQPNTTYVVSVNVNRYYVATNNGLASAVVAGPLSSVADGADGVFATTPGQFPTNSWQNSNYFRDIGFAPQAQ